MEYIKPSMRTIGLNLCIGVFYCIGCTVVPWVAVASRSWRTFLIVVSVPHILVLSFYRLVPESAQWLLSKGRTDEAIHCFRRIAKMNGNRIDENVVEGLKRYAEENISNQTGAQENVLGLLKTPKLRKKMLILAFKSMVMTLCYDAISRNVNGLKYSPFVVFSLTSTTIFPACLLILLLQDKVGRKAMASASFFISGTFTASSGLILASFKQPDSLAIIALAVVARLSINVAYNSGAQYAVELVPTVVRGQGVSIIHVMGYLATFFSPQILYLGTIWGPSPDLILGFLLILGAIVCLFLPETLHRTLPVTLKEGEEFGEDEQVLEFALCCKRDVTESTTNLHSGFTNKTLYTNEMNHERQARAVY